MKLLFVIGNISRSGGTERATSEVSSALLKQGYEIRVLNLFGSDTPSFKFPKKIKIHSSHLQEARGNLTRFSKISFQIHKEIKNFNPQATILVDSILFAFYTPLLLFSSSKVICWEHFNLTTANGTIIRSISRRLASLFSDRIIVLTERDKIAWKKKLGTRTTKIHSISNPIPNFEKRSITAYNDSKNILSIGRLTDQKGFDILLKAWKLLNIKDTQWRLRIVGSGEKENELKKMTHQLGIESSVIFTGEIRNIEEEYKNASFYVMSSRWEGLPMVLLEAQHFGLPCISTNCPTGPKEILSNGSGLLVPTENPKSLAQAIRHLIKNKDLRNNMSQKALDNALNYHPDTISRDWIKSLNCL